MSSLVRFWFRPAGGAASIVPIRLPVGLAFLTQGILSTFIVKSLFFLARYFSTLQFGPLSMLVWWPFENNRTCILFLVPATPG